LQAYRATYPNVLIKIEETVSRDAIHGLKSGSIDMAFLRAPLPELPEGVICHHFYTDTLMVLVHEGHALYDRDSLNIEDLKGVPLVMISPQQNTGLSMQLNALCEQAGFPITVAQYVNHTWTPLSLVWAKVGISIVYSSLVERIAISRVKKIPLLSSNSRNGISIALYEDGAATARHFCELLLKNASANLDA
jgi:DNA-binding transcriptional LysR family regulator